MKKIIGMIHLAGNFEKEKVYRALEEIEVYEDNGLHSAIIENYHGRIGDVIACLREIHKSRRNIELGINILPNEYKLALEFADRYNLGFIQLDHVAGNYTRGSLDVVDYIKQRSKHPSIKVYGGVWPKYYTPVDGSNLEIDLKKGMNRCEAIVITGSGTGIQIPLEKIVEFRKIVGNKELIIGAGLDSSNAREQLSIADGAIIGSYFKNGNTQGKLNEERIKEIMMIAKEYK